MKNVIKFIIFLIYTILIFLIKEYLWLVPVLAINIILMIILKINAKKAIKNLLKLSIFVLFTMVINIAIMDFNYGLLIGIKLFLVCNITYTFSKVLSYTEFATVIEKLLYPLKIFGVNPKDIGLMMCMGLTFIPILKEELEQIKNVLKVKGFKFNFINMLKNNSLIFKPFFISILERLNELECLLKAKGYQE